MAKLTRKQLKRRAYKRNLRARRRAQYQAIYDRFPACFAKAGDLRVPLKIGITADLIAAAPSVSGKILASAVKSYTADLVLYRSTFRVGEARVSLAGSPAGFVTEAEASHAGDLLMRAGLIDLALVIARSLRRDAA